MKTPMQELKDEMEKSPLMFASALTLIEQMGMLEKEKEVMQEYAWEYERECRINLERNIEKCWDKTFNTEKE